MSVNIVKASVGSKLLGEADGHCVLALGGDKHGVTRKIYACVLGADAVLFGYEGGREYCADLIGRAVAEAVITFHGL